MGVQSVQQQQQQQQHMQPELRRVRQVPPVRGAARSPQAASPKSAVEPQLQTQRHPGSTVSRQRPIENDGAVDPASMLAPRDSARASAKAKIAAARWQSPTSISTSDGIVVRGSAEALIAEEAIAGIHAKEPKAGKLMVRGGRSGDLSPPNIHPGAGFARASGSSFAGIAAVAKASAQRWGAGRTKLVLHYSEAESPMEELLRLGGGSGTDVLVEALAPNSKAARAGVRPGFALVTMNGHSEFRALPGWQVRLMLDPPITLGFDPQPVQAQSAKCTEIRLTRPAEMLGIPPRGSVCGPKDKGVLAEEVVFKPDSAPLWLSAWSDEYLQATPTVAASAPEQPLVYELRRPEAHTLVGDAVRGARALSPGREIEHEEKAHTAPWFASAIRRGLPRAPLCSFDCVAECITNDMVVETPGAAKKQVESKAARATSVAASASSTKQVQQVAAPPGGKSGERRLGAGYPVNVVEVQRRSREEAAEAAASEDSAIARRKVFFPKAPSQQIAWTMKAEGLVARTVAPPVDAEDIMGGFDRAGDAPINMLASKATIDVGDVARVEI